LTTTQQELQKRWHLLDATTVKVEARSQRDSGSKHIRKQKDSHSTNNGIGNGSNDSSKFGKDSEKDKPPTASISGPLGGTFCLKSTVNDVSERRY
jgi:hypothetical protein